MKKIFSLAVFVALSANQIAAQTPPKAAPNQPASNQSNQNVFDLSGFGVTVQPDARLILTLAALDAAGFDTKQDTVFRQRLRDDLKTLDPDLRRRLREFYERNKIFTTTANGQKVEAPPAEQVARYISLAYSLSPAPEFAAPARSTELPGSLLEVLDFAPLLQEFYRRADFNNRMPDYIKYYQAYGDRLRPQTAAMVRELTAFLNTRPQTVYLERVTVKSQPADAKGKKTELQKVETRERARRFVIVPDLLAAPGTVKLRVIRDDYYASVATDVNPVESSELRRGYLQFLVDALVFKNAKELSVHREAIRALLGERVKAGASVSPDIYLATARSLVVAADARQRESQKINAATAEARRSIDVAKTQPEKLAVSEKLKQTRAGIEKETFNALAEAFDDGAVLVFFFADQLRGMESSGFDIASSFPDMIASLDVARESARLKENESRRQQALAELAERRRRAGEVVEIADPAADRRNAALVKNLKDIEEMLNLRSYEQAEKRLLELLGEYQNEARIFFALGRTASVSASQAFDENLRDERLKKAATHYNNALLAGNATPGLLSNTHVALGKIYEFYDETEAALKQFEAAIAIGNVKDGALEEAKAGKARLTKQ